MISASRKRFATASVFASTSRRAGGYGATARRGENAGGRKPLPRRADHRLRSSRSGKRGSARQAWHSRERGAPASVSIGSGGGVLYSGVRAQHFRRCQPVSPGPQPRHLPQARRRGNRSLSRSRATLRLRRQRKGRGPGNRADRENGRRRPERARRLAADRAGGSAARAGVECPLARQVCFISCRTLLATPRPVQSIRIERLDHNTPAGDFALLLEPVLAGRDAGLLSEAGLPAVADPGAGLVRLAHERGVRVVPLSGPSSIVLALSASGLEGQRFAFHGYLPVAAAELASVLKELERQSRRLG